MKWDSMNTSYTTFKWYNFTFSTNMRPRARTSTNTFAGKTVAANIQSCFNAHLSASVEYCGGQDGHYVIRLSHLVIARRLQKSVGTLISLSLPISITLFQVSYWSTSGQKSYVYFLFFLTAKFLVENWIWCPGAGWKIGQNSLFPPPSNHLLYPR